jgi:hypothetical protein
MVKFNNIVLGIDVILMISIIYEVNNNFIFFNSILIFIDLY